MPFHPLIPPPAGDIGDTTCLCGNCNIPHRHRKQNGNIRCQQGKTCDIPRWRGIQGVENIRQARKKSTPEMAEALKDKRNSARQPATRNQQPETSNQQPATRNQKPETRNQKPETLQLFCTFAAQNL